MRKGQLSLRLPEAASPRDGRRHLMKPRSKLDLWPLLFVLLLGLCGCQSNSDSRALSGTSEHVGKTGRNRYVTPANQILTPAGLQVELPGMRPQALALSPDGKILVTSGKTAEIVVVDPLTGKILQRAALPAE